ITLWNTVPGTLDYFVRELEKEGLPYEQRDLRLALLSGDWIPVSLPERMQRFFPGVRPISLGGATEGTVWSNYFPIGEVDSAWPSIPYGRPIGNNFFYVLDSAGNLVPTGV